MPGHSPATVAVTALPRPASPHATGVPLCPTQPRRHRPPRGVPHARRQRLRLGRRGPDGSNGNGGPPERIRQLLAELADAYAHTHYAVATDGRTPEEVADSILRIYEADATMRPHIQ